ncbi:efflux RND transporter periplasmic adaptor subunit [Pontibacter qinzhouensis]|uniref:Efflux RND transporter periplasmic adaptor subunit n=1 Tax=Pontibacter qinzhouensis TaxID=2603253 RepID=A0A5C8JHU2_9BACT|nr:efflux RND transporter periplasmic adaptor subunit [Pontibacter qinzhouensis]TXK37890.1 efflux RND transporter periplasmic adaptor subunit [Pontibacter qinzhouensis]
MTARNKTYVTYILIALAGLGLGWLLFGRGGSEAKHDHTAEAAGNHQYTCSMHPQIRQEGPGKCPICGMDLIPVVAGGRSAAQANPYVLEMTPEAVALANIQTTVVGTGSTANELALSGTIQQNEQNLSAITARFPGRVERLYVNSLGQPVRKGERLASLYSPELISAQRELQEAARSRELMPELYEASKTKLRLLGLTNNQIQRIESTNELITSFDIYANASGVVTERLVATGDYVNTGSTLFTVSNLGTVWVTLDAYESNLGQVQEGAPLTFTVAGIPGKEFSGKIQFITPTLNSGTRAVQVRAEVLNPNNQFRPGMFVNATIRTAASTESTGLNIPRTAVLWTGKRSVVYVKNGQQEHPSFEMREVTLGPLSGESYAIEAGLSAGEEVVTNGVFAVDGAAQLSGNYSMMTSPTSRTASVPAAFQSQFSKLVERYFLLKNALVASNMPAARTAAGNFLLALEQVDMALLDEETHTRWIKLLPALTQNAEAIQKLQDLEKQRIAFSPLSNYLIEAVELFGVQEHVAYKQSCPMADNDAGAFWLSEQKEIRNPYFGKSMLGCGDTQKTYQPTKLPAAENPQKPTSQQHVH